jgi:hypothetical protein
VGKPLEFIEFPVFAQAVNGRAIPAKSTKVINPSKKILINFFIVSLPAKNIGHHLIIMMA